MKDFANSYFTFEKNIRAYQRVFADRRKDFTPWLKLPTRLNPDLPDEPWPDASECLRAKFAILDSPELHGFRVLVYYTQAIGDELSNASLLYNFQGITHDGRYYVSARLGVKNPALDRMKPAGHTLNGIVREQKSVNSWKDDSFTPELDMLDQMIQSIRINEPGRRTHINSPATKPLERKAPKK